MKPKLVVGCTLALCILCSCAASPPSTGSAASSGSNSTTAGTGHITYRLVDGHVYRLEARSGVKPEDISAALSKLSAGASDDWLNISPDGKWLLLNSTRFSPDCKDWACLALVKADLSSGEAVLVNGAVIHPEAFSAVASGGNRIVYVGTGASHPRDLFALTRNGTAWSPPLLLTKSSPFAYNGQPAISADGTRVLLDCGPDPYAGEGTALCEVGTDGNGFRVVLTTANAPAGLAKRGALHHPAYAPDGSVVFEGDWDGERIWRLPHAESAAVRVAPDFGNDNSPCVLPDGRIASLWLNRPENSSGQHEIKVMGLDGKNDFMALAGQDVADIGIGCGQ